MFIVDAHLDIAYNAARGRDPRMPAREQPVVDNEIATVGLPDLRAGNVGLICATIFAEPVSEHRPHGYRNGEEAHAQALSQLRWYEQATRDRLMRFVRSTRELPECDMAVPAMRDREATLADDAEDAADRSSAHGRDAHATLDAQPFVLLLEGADPIRRPDDARRFHDAGVRIVGLAWKRTRYAGGTGAPGPLTPEGRELVRVLDQFNIIHDASHLAEESFWNLMDLTTGPVIASHSNCRAIVPGDRHLTDDMIREIAKRGGAIGINFYQKFLVPPDELAKRRATLADVVRHIKHICDLVGSANHVGLGTDMDGGLGREQIPVEVETIANLHKLADALRKTGFSAVDVAAILGANWMRQFAHSLHEA
jgi:membrane dipeptidase